MHIRFTSFGKRRKKKSVVLERLERGFGAELRHFEWNSPVVFFWCPYCCRRRWKDPASPLLLHQPEFIHSFLLFLLRPCLKWKDLWSASLLLCFDIQLFLIVRATSLTNIRRISRENYQTTRLKPSWNQAIRFIHVYICASKRSVIHLGLKMVSVGLYITSVSWREKPIDIGGSSVISFVKISFTELDEMQKMARILL